MRLASPRLAGRHTVDPAGRDICLIKWMSKHTWPCPHLAFLERASELRVNVTAERGEILQRRDDFETEWW